MGRKLIRALGYEIGKIKTPELQWFVKQILFKCSDKNAIGPASSSGK